MDKLEHLSVIKVSGDDAEEFLQGQMTQSTEAINNELIHLTSFCNPQGRVLATALIQYWNEAYYLILRTDLIDDLIAWLSRYILRSNVILSNEEINIFGISEDEKKNIDESYSLSSSQSLKRLVNDQTRLILLSYEDEGKFQTIDKEKWIIQDINTGIPLIGKLNSLEYIPQMLNLDHLNAISFSKGCYTGQEVVARVEHRGKIKQRLYKIEVTTNVFHFEQNEIICTGKKVGNVVISIFDIQDKLGFGPTEAEICSLSENFVCHGLAVINISSAGYKLSTMGGELKIEEFIDSH
jgi:folate-binding protein YgfZ